MRALGRRTTAPLPPVLERSGIRLDPNRREVFRDGKPVALAPKEFAVLEVLMRSEGAVVSAEQLLEKAWDENTDPFTNVVRVTVMKLRGSLVSSSPARSSRAPSPRSRPPGSPSRPGSPCRRRAPRPRRRPGPSRRRPRAPRPSPPGTPVRRCPRCPGCAPPSVSG